MGKDHVKKEIYTQKNWKGKHGYILKEILEMETKLQECHEDKEAISGKIDTVKISSQLQNRHLLLPSLRLQQDKSAGVPQIQKTTSKFSENLKQTSTAKAILSRNSTGPEKVFKLTRFTCFVHMFYLIKKLITS